MLAVPPGVDVLEGGPHGFRRNVAVVVSRFNGDITTGLLESALAALRDCNVSDDAITVVPVPGAFELPLTALALAKTRRFSCVLALGCIIRGETPHFDLIASEAASGLQLAAIETGIPVAFGVITTETREQAEARVDRGAEAARTALEMADLFSHVRTRAAATVGTLRGRYGEDLRNLREEAVVRQQPEPLDGGHEAPLRPESPARARAHRRHAAKRAYVCTRCLRTGSVQKAV